MFIKNGRRINIDVRYDDPETGEHGIDLTSPANRKRFNVIEIQDPLRESEETHFVQEIDEPPYVVNTPKPAAEVKELKRAKRRQRAEEKLNEAMAAGFEHGGNRWHCDTVFQAQMTGYVLAFNVGILPADATVPVRTMDNVTHQMDVAQITDLAAALLGHVQGIYVASWATKDAPE